MPKRDLQRWIDRRPSVTMSAGGIVVVPPSTVVVATNYFVGREEGSHHGLFRRLDGLIYYESMDTSAKSFVLFESWDFRTGQSNLRIGYAAKYGIRLKPAVIGEGLPEEPRDLEVDAECLVGAIPPEVLARSVDSVQAMYVFVADGGDYFIGDELETILQEIGATLAVLTGGLREVTDDASEQVGDDTIVCNKGTAMTLTLLAATGSGRKLVVKNIGAGTVTVDANSTELIDATETSALLQWKVVQLRDYATGQWLITGAA